MRLGGALRKRWRYVGFYDDALLMCAAAVEIGPVALEFWGLWDRERAELHEATRRLPPMRPRRVSVGGGPVRAAAGVAPADPETGTTEVRIAPGRGPSPELELRIAASTPIEATCPAGPGAVTWTRKVAGAPAAGSLKLPGGRELSLDGRAVIDDSAGHHARRTSWMWSAGAGVASDGRAIAWNLVEGVNDPPTGSERAIWVDGEPHEPDPVSFEGLDAIAFADGSRLGFASEAERARRDSLGPLMSSSYRAPFGAFSGRLEGIEIANALGVMEQHDAVW